MCAGASTAPRSISSISVGKDGDGRKPKLAWSQMRNYTAFNVDQCAPDSSERAPMRVRRQGGMRCRTAEVAGSLVSRHFTEANRHHGFLIRGIQLFGFVFARSIKIAAMP